jgi:hypothetical protein
MVTGNLADLGRGEDEFGVRRRLLQRLQQRVERAGRQHVNLVDHIDLVAGLDRRIAHRIQQLAHVIDAGAAGGVQLQHIHVPPLDDAGTVTAIRRQIDAGPVHRVGFIVQGARQ